VVFSRLKTVDHHTKENLIAALAIVEDFCVIRVLLDRTGAKRKLDRFERTIMKGMKHQSDTLLNAKIASVRDSYMLQPFNDLMQ
jgi:hypothetical protein